MMNMEIRNTEAGKGRLDVGQETKPCECCKHIEDGEGDAACMNCKHNAPDNFEPDGKCATCQYDPWLRGVLRSLRGL